jgi:hypothetical protein
MEYRNDLEAARLRITTLEAKLDESKAALDARDAELNECRRERDRLREAKDGGASSTSTANKSSFSLKSFAAGFGLASILAGSVLVVLLLRNNSGAQGKIYLPPPAPAVPKAIVEGHVPPDVPDPLAPATIVEGQTDSPSSDVKSIDAIVQEARPQARECYKKEAEKHSGVSGSVQVLFDIDASGKVIHAEMTEILKSRSPWWSKDFESCLIGVYKKLQFPATTNPKTRAKGTHYFSALDFRK